MFALSLSGPDSEGPGARDPEAHRQTQGRVEEAEDDTRGGDAAVRRESRAALRQHDRGAEGPTSQGEGGRLPAGKGVGGATVCVA